MNPAATAIPMKINPNQTTFQLFEYILNIENFE